MGPILRVNTIYPTIQSEGVLAGTPMVIVRTQGCSVGCSWCDTKETWNPNRGNAYTPESLAAAVATHATGHRWVLLTGGEPVQQDVTPFIAALRSRWKVALETSGVGRFVPTNCDWFCLSPKHKAWAPECDALADEVKWVIVGDECVARAEEAMPRFARAQAALQPVWGSAAALNLCVAATQRLGWRLSLQQHKYIGFA